MKTSNKLLLGALIVILLAITTIISKTKFYSHSKKSSCKKVTIVKNIAKFNEVQVEGNIKVYLHQSQNYRVSVTAAADIISQISTDVENGNIHIFSNIQNINDTIIVNIDLPILYTVSASASAQVFILECFKTDTLTCISTSGSFVKCILYSQMIKCKATSGAEIELDGYVNYLKIYASSGAKINANSIIGEHCSIDGSSGAKIEVNDIKLLDVNISSGCNVKYKEISKLGKIRVENDAELSAKSSKK
jgi:hypothetical protein